MQQLKYFPFERNRYYYGKLLTEQDFVQEQQYMNGKRRLHNTFLHGVGVVAGLQTIKIDEKNVSVEDGIAIDFLGREIVMEVPAICRLSSLDGFQSIMEKGKGNYAYLCISYEEHGEMPTHNVAAFGETHEQTYDKTREGYHLYLTDKEPEMEGFGLRGLTEKTIVIYEDHQLKITQTVPIYVTFGENMDVTFQVTNLGNTAEVSVKIQETLEGAFCDENRRLSVSWDKLLLERGQSNKQTVSLKTLDVSVGSVQFYIAPRELTVVQEQQIRYLEEKKEISVELTHESKLDAMKTYYFRTQMQQIMANQYPQGIYLAKLILLKTENSYLLERVESMPYQNYVYSTHLLAGMTQQLQQDVEKMQQQQMPMHKQKEGNLFQPGTSRSATAEGTAKISLGVGGKREQRFFSHEIYHGLGLGPVKIDVCLQEKDDFYFGSSEVFEDQDIMAELAVKLDASKGSFVIGARLIEPTQRQEMTVHWWAETSQSLTDQDAERRIYIVPGKLELKVRESYYLEAVCKNVPGATVLWQVNSADGGSIAADGTYTAPNLPGVYEVVARCQEVPSLKASLFVIVRE